MAIRAVTFNSGSLTLEGRLGEPDGPPSAGIVLCHPHPLYQGSMSSALIPALQRSLLADGYAVLRFNFRGVGRSEGSHDFGRGEIDDAVAASDFLTTELPTGTQLVSAGWSFGSIMALFAGLRHPRVAASIAIAPPMTKSRYSPAPPPAADVAERGRPVLVIAGERDDISPADAMTGWVEEAGASFVSVAGADHFFREQQDIVARTVVGFLRRHGVG